MTPFAARLRRARFIMEGQTVLLDLADELGMEIETPPLVADLINARGGYAFSKEELVPLYDLTPSRTGDTETALYDQLRFGPERANASTYPDFQTYIRTVVGDEGYEFLRDMSRFRADFEYPLDAAGYLDYLDEEWDVCCTPSSPVGGMSSFIRGMQSGAEASGARVFPSEPVSSITRSDGGYTLETASYTVHAEKVVIAVPPVALNYIDGDVVDDIQAQTIYQDIVGVKVVTITQWWTTPWYADVINPALTTDNNVWRGWTTEHCMTFIEIPQEPYAAASNVTRSVYNDNADCSDYWEAVAAKGDAAVNAAVKEGLTLRFSGNGVSMPETVDIPDPIGARCRSGPPAKERRVGPASFGGGGARPAPWGGVPFAGVHPRGDLRIRLVVRDRRGRIPGRRADRITRARMPISLFESVDAIVIRDEARVLLRGRPDFTLRMVTLCLVFAGASHLLSKMDPNVVYGPDEAVDTIAGLLGSPALPVTGHGALLWPLGLWVAPIGFLERAGIPMLRRDRVTGARSPWGFVWILLWFGVCWR